MAFVGPKISGTRLFGRRVKRKAKAAVSSSYFQYGMPGATFALGTLGKTWGQKLAREDYRERRNIVMGDIAKSRKYTTKRTEEEFAARGTAGSTGHKEVLAERLRPSRTREALIAQEHKFSRRRSLYDLLFG